MNKSFVNKAYKPLYTSKKRYFLITGSRGSAKSHHVSEMLCRLTYEEGHGILFTRYTMTSAETSIIPEFRKTIERLGVEEHFHITSKDIYNKLTGSFIWFRGIKAGSNSQKANLKSLAGVTTFVVEEGEDFVDEEAFDKVDDSIRTIDKQNRVIWIMNPSTPEHFIYERWISNNHTYKTFEGVNIPISTDENVEHIHTTWRVSEDYLSDSWIEKALKSKLKRPDYYATNYLGAWKDKAEGVIFDNWRLGAFNDELPFGFGMDFGYSKDPSTLGKVAIDKENKKIYLKELLYEPHLKTAGLVSVLGDNCDRNELIIADSAEVRLIDEIFDEGFNIKKAIKGPDSIVAGVRIMQDYELIVDPESFNLIKELKNYIWHDKRSGKPIDNWNHLIDGIRYYCSYELTTPEFFAL
jgi:phage terminase large subunit